MEIFTAHGLDIQPAVSKRATIVPLIALLLLAALTCLSLPKT